MIERWSSGDPTDHMDEAILTRLAPRIERHPWWKARARLTVALLDRLIGRDRPDTRVLDAGCGWGVTLKALERAGYFAAGLDVSRKALERLDRPGRTLIEADLTKPFPSIQPLYDAVLALDVIEHLDDDRAAVESLSRLVRPGGVLILSVPALPDLFTEFDRVQGHRRRYLPETLRDAIPGGLLNVEQVFWWGSWLVDRLRRSRKRPRSRPGDSADAIYGRYLNLPPAPLRPLLDLAFHLEKRSALRGALKTGTSLFAVARRPILGPSGGGAFYRPSPSSGTAREGTTAQAETFRPSASRAVTET